MDYTVSNIKKMVHYFDRHYKSDICSIFQAYLKPSIDKIRAFQRIVKKHTMCEIRIIGRNHSFFTVSVVDYDLNEFTVYTAYSTYKMPLDTVVFFSRSIKGQKESYEHATSQTRDIVNKLGFINARDVYW